MSTLDGGRNSVGDDEASLLCSQREPLLQELDDEAALLCSQREPLLQELDDEAAREAACHQATEDALFETRWVLAEVLEEMAIAVDVNSSVARELSHEADGWLLASPARRLPPTSGTRRPSPCLPDGELRLRICHRSATMMPGRARERGGHDDEG